MRKQQYGVAERETNEVSEKVRIFRDEELRSACSSNPELG
jgi:hypothetical protein